MEKTISNATGSVRDMLGRASVIPLSEAITKLWHHLDHCPPTATESITLDQGLDRILGAAIKANHDLPPHPRSIMDGYAVRGADTFGASETMPVYLKVSGEVKMGEMATTGPETQECFRIATGGFIPPGTDAVVMFEHTVDIDDSLIEVTRPVSPGGNVIETGDDIRHGARLLDQGKKLRPQELGLLAGLGQAEISVHKKVRVGIFSTGDEIVPYDQSPPPGKIRDINGLNLCALSRQYSAKPKYYGIIPDQEKYFAATLNQALEQNDIVLFSGSSSVGVRDLGERIIEQRANPGIIVHGVAIKPGKPAIIAFADKKPLFGLPGHPVSAAVAFDLFVRPSILHLAGQKKSNLPQKTMLRALLQRNLNSASGRTDFIGVRLEETEQGPGFAAYPVLGKSGALSTMVQADGYFIINESSQGLYENDEVEVFLF